MIKQSNAKLTINGKELKTCGPVEVSLSEEHNERLIAKYCNLGPPSRSGLIVIHGCDPNIPCEIEPDLERFVNSFGPFDIRFGIRHPWKTREVE
jgi:hypothetical protein